MSNYRKLLAIAALMASVSLFGASQASAVPFGPIAGPGNIPNIDVPSPGKSVTLTVAQSGTITDLNVSINTDDPGSGSNFWHDMDIELSHLGVSVVINVGNSSAGDGIFNVTIDDEAPGSLPFGGNAIGSFKVEAASPDAAIGLSKFDGLDLAGTWTLTFVDDSFYFNEGNRLVSWSLSGDIIEYAGVPEPGTLALFGFGLAGLGYMRRRRAA